MGNSEQERAGRHRRHEEIRARFKKIAEEMPCWMIAGLPESERSKVTDSDRSKCPCAGCVFRRMVARMEVRPSKDRRELEVYPTTDEVQDVFSELLAVIERVRKYDAPGDSALPLLNVEILTRLGELKTHAEHIEEAYHQLHSRRAGVGAVAGGNTIPYSTLLERVKVGSKLHVWMVGVVESIDDNSMLMRFDLP